MTYFMFTLLLKKCCQVDPNNESSDADETPTVSIIIDINRYSALSKLLYVTAYELRFTKCVKSHESKHTGPFTATLVIHKCFGLLAASIQFVQRRSTP